MLLAVLLTVANLWPAVAASSLAAGPSTPPAVSASAVFSIDVTAGVELFDLNADLPLPPASTTKIATAIVVRQHADLTEEVTADASDVVDAEIFSNLGLQPGDVLTVEQLLYGLLLPSGNDAAHALARFVGAKLSDGSDPVATFVGAMNELAASLNLPNTHFTNPVGVDETDHYSSARDLATLASRLLEDKVLAGIVRTESTTVPVGGSNPRELLPVNTNIELGKNGVHGVKTGSTEAAGGCLVISSWANGQNRVVTVVLGSALAYDADGNVAIDDRWADFDAIMSALEREYRWVAPAAGEVPGLLDEMTAWEVEFSDPASVVVPVSDADGFRYRLQLGPAGAANTQVGRVLFFVGSEKIAERPVFQTAVAGAGGDETAEAD